MCRCNPAVKTPWCGKDGCEQPGPALLGDAAQNAVLRAAALIDEVVAAEREVAHVRQQREDATKVCLDADGRLCKAKERLFKARGALEAHVQNGVREVTV